MLNISIEKQDNHYSLKMLGHCGFDIEGRDVVCAAASILCLSLCRELENSEGMLEKGAKIIVEKGFCELAFKPKREYENKFSGIFEVVETGLMLLALSFPEYVSIE